MAIQSRLRSGSMLAATGAGLIFASAASAQRYDIFSISMPEIESQAYGLNDHGQVVGYSRGFGGSGPDLAIQWQNGNLLFLGNTRATDINNLGHSVGRDISGLAIMWKYGQPISIGTLPGFSNSDAAAINDLNQVACTASGGLGREAAYMWEDGISTELGTLGGADSLALDLNNNMQVVGQADIEGGSEHAFLWTDGLMTDLGVLEGDHVSIANAINNNAAIVGWSQGADGITPCMWVDGAIQPLARLGGDAWTVPYGINDAGLIVGNASSIELGERAVMWVNGGVIDLNDFAFGSGWVLELASAVNANGWVVGAGRHNGRREGFVLIPSPVLEVSDLFAGQPATVTMSSATPNAPAYLAYSARGFGSTPVPQLGVELQLHRPALAASGRTNANGSIMWTIDVPPGTSGNRILFQAAQVERTSNVVSRIINN